MIWREALNTCDVIFFLIIPLHIILSVFTHWLISFIDSVTVHCTS